MRRVLVFAGTSDGRRLIEALLALPLCLSVSAATDYGASLLPKSERIRVRAGALDAAGMAELMRSEPFAAVVDATHPYAEAARRNIRAAALAAALPCLRLERPPGEAEGLDAYTTVESAVAALAATEGAILAAIGTKELARFTALPGYAERVVPRVLPTSAALARCEALGFSPARILAMQGPFTHELNLALMRFYRIAHLVTKDGGAPGGFDDKISAAREHGARIWLIARPEDNDALPQEKLLAALQALLEVTP